MDTLWAVIHWCDVTKTNSRGKEQVISVSLLRAELRGQTFKVKIMCILHCLLETFSLCVSMPFRRKLSWKKQAKVALNKFIHWHIISKYQFMAPQWGAVDAEIKVPSGENTELKLSPFKAWSKSVYSHACYAYCQGFLPCLFPPFKSIHPHFPKPLPICPVLAVTNTWFLCRPAE